MGHASGNEDVGQTKIQGICDDCEVRMHKTEIGGEFECPECKKIWHY